MILGFLIGKLDKKIVILHGSRLTTVVPPKIH